MSEAHQLICPMCEGTGIKNEKKCSHCKGKGAVLLFQGKVLYWGKKLGERQFALERVMKKTSFALNVGLAVFSLSGAAVMLYWGALNGYDNFFLGNYWLAGGLEVIYFGLSLLAAIFLWRRLSAKKNKKFFVGRQRFLSFPIFVGDWSDVNRSAGKAVDVSLAFDNEARKAVEASWRLARHFNNEKVLPIHFLGVLTHFDKTAILLRRLTIDFGKFNQAISHLFSGRRHMNQAESPKLSADFRRLLLSAYAEACVDNNAKVGVLDLSLAFAKNSAHALVDELADLKLTKNKLANTADWLRGQQNWREHSQWIEKRLQARTSMPDALLPLAMELCEDLTEEAATGDRFPCVNRDEEINKILRSIEAGRRGVAILGHEGAGKMSIIREIARRALLGQGVPQFSNKRFAALDAENFVKRESAEDLLLQLIAEIIGHGNVVLVIKNAATLFDHEPALADVLRHGLLSNGFHCLVTSRPDDYKRHLTGHAIDELFEKIEMPAMDDDRAILTLALHSGPIEYRHGVYFSYDALEKAAVHAPIGEALHRLEVAASRASAMNKKFVQAEDI